MSNRLLELTTKFDVRTTEVERTLDYEAWKLETFARAGVFPKRYFGYFDERSDTAADERVMRETVRAAVDVTNAYLKRKKAGFEITDAEIAVTFIAEGGALLLGPRHAEKDRVHPILGVGLDDILSGFADRKELVKALDARLGTGLSKIVTADGRLSRFFTFREAIVGTVVMWVWEKAIAARKLLAAEKTQLSDLPLDEQFIVASLVYNSGILFRRERIEMIRDLRSAGYLARLSKRTAPRRPELPVVAPRDAPASVLLHGYPFQPTSWSAIYHVLQRYGAYVAMKRFTKVFDANDRYR